MGLYGSMYAVNYRNDEVDVFWGVPEIRAGFDDLNGTLYLHVKSGFRYNYQDEDIYELLMDILHKQPLRDTKVG